LILSFKACEPTMYLRCTGLGLGTHLFVKVSQPGDSEAKVPF